MNAQTTRSREVNRIYLISLGTNLVMLTLKITVGMITGTLVMIADGLDSSLDAIANVIAMVVTRMAGHPPDQDHPYGHRRFETLAAMMVGGFLLVTASQIIKSSFERLLSGEAPELTIANFAVMALAFCVNWVLFFMQRRAGNRLHSEVLIASSEDKRSDIMVSVTVLLSLITVRLGWGWIDAAGALVVVVLISRNALRIVKRAASVLVDRAALDAEAVRQVVVEVPGVYGVAQVRSRGPEDDVYLDLTVNVAAPTTIDRSTAIADEIRRRLRQRFEGLTEVEVSFEAARDAPPDYALIVQAEAVATGIRVHEVMIAQVETGLVLEVHVGVPADQAIAEAHEIVSRFEERLRQAIPELDHVVTHIEPTYGVQLCSSPNGRTDHLTHQALQIASQLFPDCDWHDLNIRAEADGSYALSIHCQVDSAMTVDEAHDLAETVEARIRAEIPSVRRVTIHTEPFDRSSPPNVEIDQTGGRSEKTQTSLD